MTRIDFYILPDQTLDASLRFACKLSLKAFLAGTPVHVHVTNEDQAQALDELMWDYPKHRMVPHEVLQPDVTPSTPIQISHTPPNHQEGLMINLGDEVPNFFGRFDRVAEIIVGQTRDLGRSRYKHYRDRGYPLHHHELAEWESA